MLKQGVVLWSFRARCVFKSNLRSFRKKNGLIENVFSIDFVDESGEIRLTGFGKSIALYDFVKFNCIYIVSNGDIIIADKTYNHLDNELEIRAIPFTTTIRLSEKK